MKKCMLVFLLFMAMLGALAQESSEMHQLMVLHDEVMNKMPDLVKLINKLQTVAQSSEDKASYELAIEDLKSANTSMQHWMIGFGKRFDADEMMKGKALTTQKKEWLGEEKTKILALDKAVDDSIEKGNSILEN